MFNRKLAIVDLGKNKITIEEPSLSLRKALLGGRGLNSYYLYKLLPPKVDPLSPSNILIIGTGFLTGTLAPSSSRFNSSAKSPESYILGDANCGGFFAPELRYAGFDRLILKGKAKKPSYIYVEDGTIEVRNGKDYWGMDTNDVQKALRQDLGDVETLCCGVAGENLVRFACLRTGIKNSAGRGGMGAVMGSKNVKAISVHGTNGIEISHPDKFLRYIEELKEYLTSSKVTNILGTVGTPFLYEISNEFGAIRTKNSQLNAWAPTLNAEEIEKFVDKMKETKAPILGLSGFLTFTFDTMKGTVEALEASGLRDKMKIMIGGGQIDDKVLEYTKADAYGKDAMAAVSLAKTWLRG